jgi:transcriptional regulator
LTFYKKADLLLAFYKTMPDSRNELLQGTLDLLILRTLAANDAMHGWGIAQRIQLLSREALTVNQGSLYPALHRLEAQGLVTAEWGVSENNRQAKYYHLTRAGRRQCEEESAYWRRFTAAVGLVLETE